MLPRSRRPQMPKRNLAARAGHWSARHRRIAILGWLAFVVIAFVVGGAVGTKSLAGADSGHGESQRADRAIDKANSHGPPPPIEKANFPDKADEQVLVPPRAKGKPPVTAPGFKAGVDDVV